MDVHTLKLTSPRMHGSAVKRLQEAGDHLGYDYGPNDGIFGRDTERVVRDIQKEFHLTVDGKCGPATWKKIREVIDSMDSIEKRVSIGEGMFDRRGLHEHPKLYSHQRSWDDITGVVIHQTGCKMPLTPSGWDRLNAHIGVTRDGDIVIVNEFTDMIWHAQGLSHYFIGIEIAGNFEGIEGKAWTLWKGGGGPHNLTGGQMIAMDRLFDYLKKVFEQHNKEWNYVHVHRQSGPSRRSDPGSEIYNKVVVPWSEELGATDGGPHFKVGKGHPVPKDWNPEYTASF